MTTLPLMLACTDGSPASRGAVQAALALAPRWPAGICFLQVLEFNPGFASQALDYIHKWEREAESHLADLRDQAAARGIAADTRIISGQTAFRAILSTAAALKAALIIMGRHGHTGLNRLLMGSATARVIGFAPMPVVVVPRDAPLTFRRLLAASDGSPYGRAAWNYALELAPKFGAELFALSAAPEFRDIPAAEAIVRDMLASAAARGLAPHSLALEGRPEEAIVAAAGSQGADLIIMGSHGRTGLTRLLMGSVTERVIGLAPCPVMVVKPPGEAAAPLS
uniref:Universal stress protein n=1 Tax=Gracilinema caldarium TaxID=215591 RepID=A0A7C3EEF9_9SPIR